MTDIPLCVDLDGTLLKTDTLVEGFLACLKKKPLSLVQAPFWLFKGKAVLKRKIFETIELNPHVLPYHLDFLDYLHGEYEKGRKLILATAAHERIATSIAQHLNIFSEVFSTNHTNLKGSSKCEILEKRFGKKKFGYAGNAHIDLLVWKEAGEGIVVNASPRLLQKAEKMTSVVKFFPQKRGTFLKILKAMRLYQWVKNLLVFIPLILAHRVTEISLFQDAVVAFFSFGLCASSVYLLNDLLDLEADRLHPRKRLRPFASGELSPWIGIFFIPLLLITSFLTALTLSIWFVVTLGIYYVLTLSYSLYLKRIPLIDVVLLAMLYTLRLIAGIASVHVPISPWLFAFALFFFLSLALVKRSSELTMMQKENLESSLGRGYRPDDLELLTMMGISSGFLSVLVLALYIHSEDVSVLYAQPMFLWLICPFFLYWIGRIWFLTRR